MPIILLPVVSLSFMTSFFALSSICLVLKLLIYFGEDIEFTYYILSHYFYPPEF